MSLLTKTVAEKYKTWLEKFPDGKVDLRSLRVNSCWSEIFGQLYADKRFTNLIEKTLNTCIDQQLYPRPDLLFNAFNMIELNKVKVVILGQDPYFGSEDDVPQAMGLSFSVPYGFDIPSSLKSIYANLEANGHWMETPKHGNLEFWAYQGCLMLNTSLTVLDGTANKNCHKDIWKWATNNIILYLSTKLDKLVFVLWGADALDKLCLIDVDKHEVIISSHPSGLSAHKGLRQYPAFDEVDHFGDINKYLKKFGKEPIIWQV